MPGSDFPLHRPEILDPLRRGDALLTTSMAPGQTRFQKGEEIIRTGERCDKVYRLETGWVARTRLLEDGRRSIITIFFPGELFGVKSLLLREQPDSIHAVTAATVASIDYGTLRHLFETEPTVALRIAFQLGEDERRLHNYVIGLGRASATERIATMLVEWHGRLVRAGSADGGTYACPLTQQDMGDFLGLTLVHVNRVLRQLRLERIVTISRGVVEIHDLEALYRLAEPVLDIFERSRPEFGGPALH